MTQFSKWLEERAGISQIYNVLFLRKIPRGAGWLYTLGFATLFVFILQAVTGTILALFYVPSPDHAYETVRFIQYVLPFGSLIRGIHHWGSSAMIVLVGLHLVTVFVMGAYKHPREATWVAGVILLLLVVGSGFTGYLLPWDQKAYWATTVGTSMAGTVPLIGDAILKIIRGGSAVGALTLTRFYGTHMLILPALFLLTIGVHLYLVVYLGVSVPPWLWESKKEELPADEKERYNLFKKQGHPFWPDTIVEDAIISLIVFLILVALAVFVGAGLEARADPVASDYVPRPEWYFLFLFQLLKLFPGSLEWIGVIVIPSLIVLALLFLPFYSREKSRRPERRPVAMTIGALFIAGVVVLTYAGWASTPPTKAAERGIVLNATQVVGRSLYEGNCAVCHGENGEGTKDGPSLSEVGALRDPAFIHSYIENSLAMNPNAKMPVFVPPPGEGQQVLTHQQIEAITQYLMTFRGEEGGN